MSKRSPDDFLPFTEFDINGLYYTLQTSTVNISNFRPRFFPKSTFPVPLFSVDYRYHRSIYDDNGNKLITQPITLNIIDVSVIELNKYKKDLKSNLRLIRNNFIIQDTLARLVSSQSMSNEYPVKYATDLHSVAKTSCDPTYIWVGAKRQLGAPWGIIRRSLKLTSVKEINNFVEVKGGWCQSECVIIRGYNISHPEAIG